MKKTLLQKVKSRILKLSRPKHKVATRIKKGLHQNSTIAGGIQTIQRGGLGIEYSRKHAGRGRRMRFSRSKYNPIQEDLKHFGATL